MVGGGAAGLVGFGGSAGIATIENRTDAYAGSGVLLSAGDALEVLATGRLNSGEVHSYAGAAGVVGLGAAFSLLDSDNSASASLSPNSTVVSATDLRVNATTRSNLEAKAYGVAVGAGAVGFVYQ